MEKAFPSDFISLIKSVYPTSFKTILKGLTLPPITSVKVNANKVCGSLNLEQVPWNKNGYYLPSRPSFVSDPWYHAGAYYPQEASSMAVEMVAKILLSKLEAPLVADLCAAPGGKSIGLIDALNGKGHLLSNEIVPKRAKVLRENLIKWGSPNFTISNNAPQELITLKNQFDLVLVDAPCSGEGMFRKDPVAISEWSLENVNQCGVRQQDILKSAIKLIKPNGYLIYSTCTFNKTENEDQVNWLTKNGFNKIEFEELLKYGAESSNSKHEYHFFPGKVKGEGFFLAVLQKEATSNQTKNEQTKTKKRSHSIPFLTDAQNLELEAFKETSYAVLNGRKLPINKLNHLRIIARGIAIAEQKGKKFVPHPNSIFLANTLKLPKTNISFQESIGLLSLESPLLKIKSKGWGIATFKDVPISVFKHLGNRTNNYFPKEFRIRIDKSKLTDFSLSNYVK